MKRLLLIFFCFVLFTTLISQDFNGFALYNRQNNNTAYLIDKDGNIAKTWNCNVACNYTVSIKRKWEYCKRG